MPAVKIPNYNYTIDEEGNIFSLSRQQYIQPFWTSKNQVAVKLWRDNKLSNHMVHRLVAKAFIPNPNQLLPSYPFLPIKI